MVMRDDQDSVGLIDMVKTAHNTARLSFSLALTLKKKKRQFKFQGHEVNM